MTIEFTLSTRQREMQSMIHQFAATIIRPQAMAWDRAHAVPHDFLRQMGRHDEARLAYGEALLLSENMVERAFLTERLGEVES